MIEHVNINIRSQQRNNQILLTEAFKTSENSTLTEDTFDARANYYSSRNAERLVAEK